MLIQHIILVFLVDGDVAQFHNSGIIAKILELLELTYLYIAYNSLVHKRILLSGETFQLDENHTKYHQNYQNYWNYWNQ